MASSCSPASSSWKRTGSRCANSAFPSWKPGPIRAIPSTCWSACPTTTPASWRPAIWPSAATGAWPSWPATAAAANCAARASRCAAQRGLEVVAELAVDNPQTIADGRAALARLLSQGGKFDAVFCANDLLAVGAMFEARDRKLAVPRDLAVLGFGETDIAGEIQPGLTTIGVDSLGLGRRAGEMLLQRLGGGMPAHPHQVMPLRIHARASV
ncbi:substrate-binding domain-containing protein [Achromobacter xylosoxidans]